MLINRSCYTESGIFNTDYGCRDLNTYNCLHNFLDLMLIISCCNWFFTPIIYINPKYTKSQIVHMELQNIILTHLVDTFSITL